MTINEVDAAGLLREAKSRFRLGAGSLHGPAHWEAVRKNSEVFARELGADRTIVHIFAALHDCMRENETESDTGHGPRAAALATELNGRYYDLSKDRLRKLVDAIYWHDAGLVLDDADIAACWASDRVELRRCGIAPERWGFSPAAWDVYQGVILAGQAA